MYDIRINEKKNTIEVTKKFAVMAMRFGTEAYNQLQEVRKDYPTYRVETKSSHAKKQDNHKGLTYVFMENYIKTHDNEDKSIMAKFLDLRGLSEEAKANGAKSKSYSEITDWFFNQFPAFAEFEKKRNELLTKSAA